MKVIIKFFIMMFITVFKVYSQELETIITDRPDVTESSFTVPKGSFQLETGFLYSSSESQGTSIYVQNYTVTDEYINIPTTLARYGITEYIELRAGAEIMIHNIITNDPEINTVKDSDLSGVQLALKFKLAKQKNLLPSTAVILGSTFPAVSTISSSDIFDPAVVFCFSNQISEKFSAGYNLGFDLNDGFTSSASGNYSLSLSYSISGAVGMFGEFYGIVPFTNVRASNYVDGGFTILIKKNLQIDFSGGYGLNSGITEYFLNTGFSFRLPK